MICIFYITMNDGVKLAVTDLNPQGCETVVMIHGWPLSHKIYEYQAELLTRHGFRVVMMDLRGFGASDAPASGYSYDRMSDDIYTVVSALRLPPFTMVAFSMGGAIAMRYMGRYNGYCVKRLALLGAAGPCYTRREDFPYGVTKESVNSLLRLASTDRPQLCENFSRRLLACPHSGAVKDWFRDIALEASGLGTLQAGIRLRDEDCRADMARIRVPTGIFHGKKDQIVPFELALVQHQGIPNSVLYPFEESGHGIFYDELILFNRRLLDFLAQDSL